jgi:hypothetical protein
MYQERQFPISSEQAVTLLTTTLGAHGYRLERSFDLRSALHDHSECSCPHHGTAQCTCQYVVLLAYEQASTMPPVVITAHERDGLTRLRVEPCLPGSKLTWPLLAALDEAANTVVADA